MAEFTDDVMTGHLPKLMLKVDELQIECRKTLKTTNPANEILQICDRKCEKAKRIMNSKGSSEEQQIKDVLTEYTQALLDFTYFEENKLVDEEFPESTAKERLHHILGYLNKVDIIVSDIFGRDADMIDVLGVDIVECLYWRKGALYYMYSHTVNQDKDRVKRNLQDFTQSLRDGVEFLTKMSNLRVPLSEQEQVDYNDECTLKLIQQGVFSDTHLLALMYSGEMCYWYTTVAQDNGELNPLLSTGKQLLQKFIRIVSGPMKNAGWDCSRARQLLQQLNSASSSLAS